MRVEAPAGPYGLGDPRDLFAEAMDEPFVREYEVSAIENGEMADLLDSLEVDSRVGAGPDGTLYADGRILGLLPDEAAYVWRIARERHAEVSVVISATEPSVMASVTVTK